MNFTSRLFFWLSAFSVMLSSATLHAAISCPWGGLTIDEEKMYFYGECGNAKPEVSFTKNKTRAILKVEFDEGMKAKKSKDTLDSSKSCNIYVPYVYPVGCKFSPNFLSITGSAAIHEDHYGDADVVFMEDSKRQKWTFSTDQILEQSKDYSLKGELDASSRGAYWTPCKGRVAFVYSIKIELYDHEGTSSDYAFSTIDLNRFTTEIRNRGSLGMRKC